MITRIMVIQKHQQIHFQSGFICSFDDPDQSDQGSKIQFLFVLEQAIN